MQEELRRRNPNRTRNRCLAALLVLLLAAAGAVYYLEKKEELLEQRFAKGMALAEAGEYEDAVQVLRRLYDGHPGFSLASKALFQSAEILHLNLRSYQQALLSYLLVMRDYPESAEFLPSLRQVAEIYKFRLQDYGEAIVAYQKLLDLGAKDGDVLQNEVADAYFRLNNFEQARIEFESLLKDYPGSPLAAEVQYRAAICLSLEGQLSRAESVLSRVIEEWPKTPWAMEARFAMASVLEEKEELKAALEMLENLQGVYPNGEALAKRLAQVKERIKKKKKAI